MLLQCLSRPLDLRAQDDAGDDSFATLTLSSRHPENQALANGLMLCQLSLDALGRNLSPGNIDLVTGSSSQIDAPGFKLAEVARAKHAIRQSGGRGWPVACRHRPATHLKAAILRCADDDPFERQPRIISVSQG